MGHNEAILKNDERMFAGQFLTSKNGFFHALMEEDGNFVIYRGDLFKAKSPGYEKTARWRLFPDKGPGGGTGYHIYMQGDGNLVIYRQNPQAPMWNPQETFNNRKKDGRFLELYNDGWLDIRGIWSAGAPGERCSDPEWESIEYIMDPPPKITPGPPGVALSAKGCNSTSTAQTQDFSVTYQETSSTSWKISTSLKIGLKTQVKSGIPFLAEGKVEVSTELTQSVEWNKVTTQSKGVTIPLKINVLPAKCVIAKCTWHQSTLAVPYRAVGKVKFEGYPEKLPVYAEGIYEGVTTHDVRTYWKETSAQDEPGLNAVEVADLADDGWKLIEQVKA